MKQNAASPRSSDRKRHDIRDLLANLIVDQKSTFWLAAFLLLLTGASEGFSIALLIPFIGLINTADETIDLSPPAGLSGGESFSIGLGVFLLAFLAIIVIRAALVHVSALASARLVQDYVKNIRMRLFDSIIHAKWSYLSGLRNADLYHAMTADIDRIQATVTVIMELIKSSILILIYLSLSLLISWRLTLAAAAIGTLLILALRPLRRRASQHGETYTSGRREQSRIISDFLDNMKITKAYSAEERFSKTLEQSMTGLRETIISFQRLSSRVNFIVQAASALALCAIVYLALTAFDMTAAGTLAILVLYFRFAPKVVQLQAHAQTLNSNMSALQNVLSHMRDAENEQEVISGSQSGSLSLKKEIRLENVSFQYDGRKQAIRGASVDIPANKITVFAGATGSGKSTLADLLMGMITQQQGTIKIDGALLDERTIGAWRRSIGYVPQDPFLFHATIRENLMLADQEADEAALWTALRAAHAEKLVRTLPAGLDTIVGSRGQLLSGGERQRLVLARALLRKPALLILDEATSALDWEHETAIATSLEALKQELTIVMIAHRRRIIALADNIVILQDGAVIEQGPPKDLLMDGTGYLSRLENSESG
ncbi:ABC transporter ATP-binding protein [Hyphococcus sp.]|uniref:ABC transporter ATP-binding protein n=1 Tax=Hyphococcus sp. TaxID=2038636 RepID=UPI0035C6972F